MHINLGPQRSTTVICESRCVLRQRLYRNFNKTDHWHVQRFLCSPSEQYMFDEYSIGVDPNVSPNLDNDSSIVFQKNYHFRGFFSPLCHVIFFMVTVLTIIVLCRCVYARANLRYDLSQTPQKKEVVYIAQLECCWFS